MSLVSLRNWEDAQAILEEHLPIAEVAIEKALFYLNQYPAQNNDQEQLAKLLAYLNVSVAHLGELQSIFERLKNWTEKRWDMEKALSAVKIMRTGKAANYANLAKYEELEEQGFLSLVVNASAMYMRVQNARSSARDTTEAMRSRISQIKSAVRSS